MATLAQRLVDLATAIGVDIKDIRAKQGDLTSLSTSAKTSLVASINELVTTIAGLSGGGTINDSAGNGDTGVTWSADKIFDSIEAAKTAVKNDLVNGASSALDTLSELADALGNDPSFATTIASSLANRVRYDAAQTLSGTQKTQACENLGIGEPDTNFVTTYNTAKA